MLYTTRGMTHMALISPGLGFPYPLVRMSTFPSGLIRCVLSSILVTVPANPGICTPVPNPTMRSLRYVI